MKTSVCMAVYNGATFLKRSIPSILSQLKEEDELIIVNDYSTDHSILILESFQDKRIKIISNSKNEGVSFSFFKALKIAKGELIFIADQDDIWKKNKVDVVHQIFSKNKIALLVHDADIIQNSILQEHSLFEINNSGRGFWKNLKSDTYVGCCMIMTANAKEKLLPQKAISGVYYDHFLGLMAEKKSLNILFSSEKLINYNRHSQTHTNIYKRRRLDIIFWDRIKLVMMLLMNR